MSGVRLAELAVYPVKSAGGITLREVNVTSRGLEHDRRWMVIDAQDRLVTLRERPELSAIEPSVCARALRLRAPHAPPLELPLAPTSGVPLTVTMWTERVDAWLIPEARAWISHVLAGDYRLVYMSESGSRTYPGQHHTPLSFVDGNPLSLVSRASLDDLNARLDTPVDLRRFRHNLIVEGCDAFAEDAWQRVQIGALVLESLGPCVRCMVISIDPDTGAQHAEPLRTLARYRRTGHQVRFGQLYRIVSRRAEPLRCGSEVQILETYGAA